MIRRVVVGCQSCEAEAEVEGPVGLVPSRLRERSWHVGRTRQGRTVASCPWCRPEGAPECRSCPGGALADLLGHDPEGHRIHNVFMRETLVRTPRQLVAFGPERTAKVTGVGPAALERIVKRLEGLSAGVPPVGAVRG